LIYFLTDITGKVLIKGRISPSTKDRIEVDNLPSGTYLIHFSDDTRSYILKAIKR
jgi:hypothetical protein